jgi:hypothetical protein
MSFQHHAHNGLLTHPCQPPFVRVGSCNPLSDTRPNSYGRSVTLLLTEFRQSLSSIKCLSLYVGAHARHFPLREGWLQRELAGEIVPFSCTLDTGDPPVPVGCGFSAMTWIQPIKASPYTASLDFPLVPGTGTSPASDTTCSFPPNPFRRRCPHFSVGKSLCYSPCSSELTPTGKRDICDTKAHYYGSSVTMKLSLFR